MAREETVTIRTEPGRRLPGINVRPGDAPGEAADRALGLAQEKSQREKAAQEAQRKNLLDKKITDETQQKLRDASQSFSQNIRQVSGVQGRLEAQKTLANLRRQIQLASSKQRQKEGLSLTSAQQTALRSSEITETRKEAGTFGKGFGRAKEVGIIKKFRGVKKEEEKEIPEGLAKDLKSIPKAKIVPLQIGPVPKGVALRRFLGPFRNIELPEDPEGLVGFGKDLLRFTGITKEKPLTKTAQNFFQKNKLDPNNPNAIQLKAKADEITSNFEEGRLTEGQANLLLEKSLDDFTRKEITRDIPKNIALGAGFALISKIPGLNFLLAADLLLKRKSLSGQFKKFPKETILSTSSFLVGGLIGGAVLGGVKSLKGIEINPESIRSISRVTSAEKSKLVNEAINLDPTLKATQKSGKLTSTTAFEVVTADGRSFKIIEFTKLSKADVKGGLRGTKEFVGFETAKIKGIDSIGRTITEQGEVILGRGVERLTAKKGEVFVRAIKFKPANTRLGRFVQKRFGSGQIIDVVERSKVISSKGGLVARRIAIESETGILSIQKVNAGLVKRVLKILERVDRGGKANFGELKSVINLERRLRNVSPFSEAEFKNAGFRTLSQAQIISFLKELKLTAERRKLGKKGIVIGERKIVTEKRISKAGVTVEAIPFAKFKKKVEVKRAFATLGEVKLRIKGLTRKESPLIKRGAILAKQTLVQKFKQAQSKLQKELQKRIQRPSPAVITAVTAKVKPVGILRSPVLLRTRLLQSQLIKLKTQQSQLIKTAQRQKQKPTQAFKSFSALRVEQTQKLTQKTKLRLKAIQIQRIKVGRQLTRERSKAKLKLKPTLKLEDGIGIRQKGIAPFKKKVVKEQGYHALFKKGNKFIRINRSPVTKNQALDLGARVVDRSLSATFKIKKTNRKAKPPQIRISRNYFKNTQRKFRDFKIRKGKQVPLKNKFIERKGKPRLDTGGERRKIQASAVVARLRRTNLRIKPAPKFKRLK